MATLPLASLNHRAKMSHPIICEVCGQARRGYLFFTSEKGTNLQTNLSQVLSRGLLIYS